MKNKEKTKTVLAQELEKYINIITSEYKDYKDLIEMKVLQIEKVQLCLDFLVH